MRPSCCQSCLASLLKFLNFLQAFVGVSIIIYSVWMLNHWNKHGLGFDLNKLPAPWFVCCLMGVGVLLLLIAFTGHVAAEAINGCCLCFYAVLTIMLVLVEATLVGYLFLNKHWKEDLPYDSTGELERLLRFIEGNIDVCKWVAITVVIIQALSLLLAVVLRVLVPTRRVDYDSDDDFAVIRKPLLNPQVGPAFGSTSVGSHSDIWGSRIKQKFDMNQSEFSYNAVDPKTSN